MMRRAALAAAICASLAGCATAPGVTGGTPTLRTQPDEPVIKQAPKEFKASAVARGVELDLNDRRSKEFGIMPIPALTAYLNSLLDRIKREAGMPDLPSRVYVTVRNLPEHHATADGNIFLSSATVTSFESEAEVVAMLSHELAHVLYGHFDIDVASNLQKQVQSGLLMAKKVDDMLARDKGGKPLSAAQEKALKHMRTAIELTDKVLIPAFSREQERTADRFAIDVTRRLGYPYGAGLKVMLEKLANVEEEQKKQAEAAQQKEMEKLVEAGFQDPNAMFGDLKSFFTDAAISIVSKSHYGSETRTAEAKEYNDRFYPRAPGDSDRKEAWKRLLDSPQVSRALANYANAREALALSEDGKTDQALVLAKKAVDKPTHEHAFPQLVLARALMAKGDRKNALASLRKAINSPEPVWEAFTLLSEWERNYGKRELAGKALEAGFIRLGTPPNKRPELIRVYASYGDKDKVKAMELECHAAAPRLREECSQAASSMGWGLEKSIAQRKTKM